VPEPGISLAGAIAAATFAFLAHRRSSGAQNRLGSNRIAHRDWPWPRLARQYPPEGRAACVGFVTSI